MPNEVTTNKTFEQKIGERLREQIGDLIPDEALAKLIEQAIQKNFFEDIVVKTDQWGRADTKRAWFKEEVERQTRQRISQALDAHFKDHGKQIGRAALELMLALLPEALLSVMRAHQNYRFMDGLQGAINNDDFIRTIRDRIKGLQW